MKPEFKIKATILKQMLERGEPELSEKLTKLLPFYTESQVTAAWDAVEDWRGDYVQDFRGGDAETDLDCEWSRHYESKGVAAEMWDGSWVGWTYWYGGGKHGEPEAIDWMEDAYEVEMREETQVVKVFKRKDG